MESGLGAISSSVTVPSWKNALASFKSCAEEASLPRVSPRLRVPHPLAALPTASHPVPGEAACPQGPRADASQTMALATLLFEVKTLAL